MSGTRSQSSEIGIVSRPASLAVIVQSGIVSDQHREKNVPRPIYHGHARDFRESCGARLRHRHGTTRRGEKRHGANEGKGCVHGTNIPDIVTKLTRWSSWKKSIAISTRTVPFSCTLQVVDDAQHPTVTKPKGETHKPSISKRTMLHRNTR